MEEWLLYKLAWRARRRQTNSKQEKEQSISFRSRSGLKVIQPCIRPHSHYSTLGKKKGFHNSSPLSTGASPPFPSTLSSHPEAFLSPSSFFFFQHCPELKTNELQSYFPKDLRVTKVVTFQPTLLVFFHSRLLLYIATIITTSSYEIFHHMCGSASSFSL